MSKIFYFLYRYSVERSTKGYSAHFADPKIASIMLLSSLEIMNLTTVWMFFSLPDIKSAWLFEIVVFCLVLIGVNWLYFIKSKRFVNLSSRYGGNKIAIRKINIISRFYIILTIIVFFLVFHSILLYEN